MKLFSTQMPLQALIKLRSKPHLCLSNDAPSLAARTKPIRDGRCAMKGAGELPLGMKSKVSVSLGEAVGLSKGTLFSVANAKGEMEGRADSGGGASSWLACKGALRGGRTGTAAKGDTRDRCTPKSDASSDSQSMSAASRADGE